MTHVRQAVLSARLNCCLLQPGQDGQDGQAPHTHTHIYIYIYMCAFVCVCSNFVSFLGCVFFCSRHEKQSETRSPAKQRLGPALVFCSKFEAVRSCSSSQPPLCGACLSCPFSAIAEKNNTKIAGGAQCAHEKLGRPPEEKKNEAGGRCVRAVGRDTARAPQKKKTLGAWPISGAPLTRIESVF